jgi:hypothetical protein
MVVESWNSGRRRDSNGMVNILLWQQIWKQKKELLKAVFPMLFLLRVHNDGQHTLISK